MKISEKVLSLTGYFLFFSEIIKQFLLTFIINAGCYNWWYFPFQLCSLPIYLLLFYRHTKSDTARQTLLSFFMTYNLLGGIAVFFDTSGMYYPLMILTVHSYVWHILLIMIGIYSGYLLLHSVHLSWTLFLKSTLLYGVSCLIAEFLNLTLSSFGSINMFYISPYFRMEQVFFCKIADYFGNIAGIISYLLGTVSGAALLFLAWRKLERLFSLYHKAS